MPHHKSNKKRLITAEKSRLVNKSVRSEILTLLKVITKTVDKEAFNKIMPVFFSKLDKAVRRKQGNFTIGKVARYKAKTFRLLNKLQG